MRRAAIAVKAPARREATQCTLVARPREVARATVALPMRAPKPKFAYVRDDRLQAMCRAIPCQLCGAAGQGAGVTWAHSNQSRHGKGGAVKASDVFVAALCWECHAEIDQGRYFGVAQKIALWNRAHVSTLATAIGRGLWPAGIALPAIEEPAMHELNAPPASTSTPGVTVKTLVDGTITTSDSREWQRECLHWHRHVLNLRGRSIDFIKGYVADVRRKEGEEAARRLKQAYADDWQSLQKPAAGQQGGATA